MQMQSMHPRASEAAAAVEVDRITRLPAYGRHYMLYTALKFATLDVKNAAMQMHGGDCIIVSIELKGRC